MVLKLKTRKHHHNITSIITTGKTLAKAHALFPSLTTTTTRFRPTVRKPKGSLMVLQAKFVLQNHV